MALNIAKPFINVTDENGLPIVGAVLYVYLPGTTTLTSIYSDEALSVSLPNPLSGDDASDARGDFPRAYIAPGTYKLRAETSAGVLIFQEDNIDTGLPASTGALPISRGGTSATTAAGARAALDVPSNSELADLSDSISTIQASLQNIVSFPQGRLTPTSGTPIISTGVTAGTAVYYTPYVGNLVPIYDGAQFNVAEFAELTLTLNANHVANAIYDIFIFDDGGTTTIGTGPAWNTATAGSGARGSGAGTTQLVRTQGLLTNAVSMTARNGATTYTVAAFEGTYVGSISMDGTNGQVTCHTVYGQSRKFGVWNYYSRVPIALQAGDSTGTPWTYTASSVWRQSRADTTNFAQVFEGVAEEVVSATFHNTYLVASGASTYGIGVNSTAAPTGSYPAANNEGASANTRAPAHIRAQPALGLTNFMCLEWTAVSGTFSGTQPNMNLIVEWRG